MKPEPAWFLPFRVVRSVGFLRRLSRRQMLHMFRSRPACLALFAALLLMWAGVPAAAQAPAPETQAPVRHAGGEANLVLPDLGTVDFQGINGRTLLLSGLGVCVLGLVFGMVIFNRLKN